MSRVLIIATLAFLALASGVLVWEGLALGAAHGRPLDRSELRRVRFRFAVGVAVFAMVLWVALGIVTRAW